MSLSMFAPPSRPNNTAGTKCKITLNTNTGRVHIEATLSYNDAIRRIPNVRFEKRRAIWVAPLIRRNIEEMQNGLFKLPNVEVEQAVLDRIAELSAAAPVIRKEKFPADYEFKTKPFPYQLDALDHMWSTPLSALFMEMGTGKSKTFIDYACAKFKAGEIDSVVVMCFIPLRSNWVDEWNTHATVKGDILVVDTTVSSWPRVSKAFIEKKPAPGTVKVVIAGIESFQQGVERGKAYEFMSKYVRCHTSVQAVDESHKIKGHQSNRAINIEYIGREDKLKSILTGSPISQGIEDLYQQFQYLSPDIIGLGDFYSFRNRYCEMGGFGNKTIVGYTNVDELMDILRPYVFQVTKEQALPFLPPKTYSRHDVEMTKEQKDVYNKIKKEKRADLSQFIAHNRNNPELAELVCENVLTAYTALQQISSGYISYWEIDETTGKRERVSVSIVPDDKNPKFLEVVDLLEEFPERPAIIWAKFNYEIDGLVRMLSARYGADSVAQFHGRISKEERDEQKRLFLDGKARYFVSNQATGGTGLTLNKATQTLYVSNSFVLIDRTQSEDRNHRIGQENPVRYVDIVARGTVDESILAAIKSKRDLALYVREQMAKDVHSVLKLLD